MILPEKENLPPELLKLDQWISWFEEKKGDKLTKVPSAPWKTGHWKAASVKDPANWTSFDNALEWAKKKEGYGIGFALKEGGGLVFIDCDKCINEEGEISEFASDVIKRADSYADISPSGEGVHVIMDGDIADKVVKDEKIEIYTKNRYATMTGRRCKETPLELGVNQDLLDELLSKFAKRPRLAILDKKVDRDLPIVKILGDISKLHRRGKELQGEHPVHGSRGGMNFAVNEEKNCWHCFRCQTGGGPVSLLGVLEGIVNCEDCVPGRIRGETHKKIVAAAKERGIELAGWKEEITDKFITDTIMEKHLFYCDIVDENQILYLFTGNHWSNAAAESVILNELSDIFKDEERRRGMLLERTVNFVKGQAMNRKVEPKPPELIPFKNGMYDLGTGELKPHDPKYFYVNLIPHDYAPNARCPKWMKWLAEVLKLEDTQFLQEWMGYNIYEGYPEACFVILIGVGQNAKSCFNVLFKKLVGEKNVTEISLADLTYGDFAPAQLEHKLANISDDIGSTVIKNTSRLKRASAGSGMTVGKKFQREHDIAPYAKLTYSCNEPPEIQETSEAIRLRLKVIEFPYVFVKKPVEGQKQARDRKEVDGELESEIPGIINWVLEGLKRFLNNNSTFSETRSTEETWKLYQRKSKPVFSFMEECIKITDDEIEKMTIEEMYAALKEWLKRNGIKLRISRTKMIRDLRDEGIETRQKREDERKRMYYGVTLSHDYSLPVFPQKELFKEIEEIEEKRGKGEKRGNKKRVTPCHKPEKPTGASK